MIAATLSAVTKRLSLGLLAGYSWIVLAVTVFSRTPTSVPTYELQLLWSYSIPSLREQVVLNILSFVSIGVLGAKMWNGRVKSWLLAALLYGIGLSTVVELMQLVGHRGLFEFDDIIDNGIGTLAGMLLFMVVRWMVEMVWHPNADDELKTT